MTPLRDKAIAVADAASVEWNRAPLTGRDVPDFLTVAIVDALLAAGMLADPEECARTYSLISELIATGKDDDAERAYRLAVKAWRRARDVADGKPLAQRDGEARIERAARALWDAMEAGERTPLPWDGAGPIWRKRCEDCARAALAAADQEEKP